MNIVEAKISSLEADVRFLKLQIRSLTANFRAFGRPGVKSLPDRITPAQIAKVHGCGAQNVRKYRGIWAGLRQFEQRSDSGRIYFKRGDYEKFLREAEKTPEEKATNLKGSPVKSRRAAVAT